MEKLRKNDMNAMLRVLLVLSLVFMFAAFSGCNDEDDNEGTIRVCNNDNNEYVVRLHRNSDGVALREFKVGEWYDSDVCDEFKDIEEGRYYLTIRNIENQGAEYDRSSDFYLDKGDYETFVIDSTGDIERD